MKKRLFTLFTAFVFAFIAVGAWDCGCAFAATEQKTVSSSEEQVMKCHGSTSEQTTSQEKDTCCPGCQLEKAYNNAFSQIEVASSAGQKTFSLENELHKTILSSLELINKSELMRLRSFEGRSVPINISNPIYLIVQSFLI